MILYFYTFIYLSVGETCRNVIWNCLVEDTALFLRHFFEKFTNRDKQVKNKFIYFLI